MRKGNNISFKRDPQIPGIEICEIKKSSHVFPNHAHDDVYSFGLMEYGGSYWNEKKRISSIVKPGDIALINPGLVHSGVPVRDNSSSYKMIYIELELMKKLSDDILENDNNLPEFEKVVIKNESIANLFKDLFELFSTDSDQLEEESVLTAFMGQLILKYNVIKAPLLYTEHEHKYMNRAFEYLSARLDEKLSLDDVASSAGLSRYHFLRVFKKNTGITPHIYRTQKRIETARKLIRKNIPLSRVAMETGFTDQSHLTNKFKQYIGVTPGQYLVN